MAQKNRTIRFVYESPYKGLLYEKHEFPADWDNSRIDVAVQIRAAAIREGQGGVRIPNDYSFAWWAGHCIIDESVFQKITCEVLT